MIFSSPIFLFIFLPAVFILYRLSRNINYKNILLALAGVIFYSFGQLQYVYLLFLSVLINYLAGLIISRNRDCGKAVLAVAVAADIAMLCIFKYTDFIISNINAAAGCAIPLTGIELPIGISFFTFQGISYVIDVYRYPESGEKSFIKVFLYISFFPRLLAGPIVKYADCAMQLSSRACSTETTAYGIRRFIKGLAKKILISDVLGNIADSVFNIYLASGPADVRLMWLGSICYMLQIYYDFSGYSDMAIGIGNMFGFSFKENFNYPYGAASIKEFWRKWHISLSGWFKDYLYIPLGGNRKGKARAMLNRMIVFICTGIWHGANWTFIFWGLCHGILSSLEDIGVIPTKKLQESRGGRIIGRVYTLLAVLLLFTVFRADSLGDAFKMIAIMFSGKISADGGRILTQLLTPAAVFILILAVALAGNLVPYIKKRFNYTGIFESSGMETAANLACIVLFALSVFSLSKGGFSPFIYFQF